MIYEFINRPTLAAVKRWAFVRWYFQWRSFWDYRKRVTWRVIFLELQLLYWTGLLVMVLELHR